MKRLLVILLVLALVAGGAFYLFSRQSIRDGAQLVPANTVFYAALPDLRRTTERWPKTALARIGAEPSVAQFLEKPLSRLASGGTLEGVDFLLRVKPGRFFLAVTTLRDTGADVVLGFQFFGGRKDLDAAFDRLYRELGKSLPEARRTTADHQGDTITSFAGDGPILFTAVHGSWGFLSNSEAALKTSLDRAAGRDRSPSLVDETDFKTVAARVGTDPDLGWFARIQPAVEALLAFARKNNAAADVDEAQLAQLKKITAGGGTLRLDGADLREATFILQADLPTLPPVDRAPLAFTTPATTFFYDAILDLQSMADETYHASLPPDAQAFLRDQQIDLKQLPKTFGTDFGLVVNWSPDAMIPALLGVVEIKDRKAVEALVDKLLVTLGVATSASEIAGARVLAFPALSSQLAEPALAISDKFLFASLTTPELERALTLPANAPTLEAAAAFKPALPVYTGGVQAFAYLDSKTLFEGIYNRVRPIAMLAAVVSPELAQFVDIEKLPETEAISRHLAPILYSQKQLPEGWLIESSGPVTLSQAIFAGAAGAGAFYAAQAAQSR